MGKLRGLEGSCRTTRSGSAVLESQCHCEQVDSESCSYWLKHSLVFFQEVLVRETKISNAWEDQTGLPSQEKGLCSQRLTSVDGCRTLYHPSFWQLNVFCSDCCPTFWQHQLHMLMETYLLCQAALPVLPINNLFFQGGGQTNAGSVRRTFGGVGRNLAGAYCLGLPVGSVSSLLFLHTLKLLTTVKIWNMLGNTPVGSLPEKGRGYSKK